MTKRFKSALKSSDWLWLYQNPPQCLAYTAKQLGGGEAAGDRREPSGDLRSQ